MEKIRELEIELVLKWVGILFISLGIIYGITQISNLVDLKENEKFWKEAYEEDYTNELIEAEYITNKQMYTSGLTLTLVPALSCVLSGIFFLALSAIINLLQQIAFNTSSPQRTDRTAS